MKRITFGLVFVGLVHVAVLLWSSDGRALAVTDHTNSNESAIWVFTGPKLLPGVNVEDRLRASLGRVSEIFKNGHRYFEALDWSSSDLLRFRVRAYDNQPGKEYNRIFRYHKSGGVSRDRSE
jgi:hypothetical protein